MLASRPKERQRDVRTQVELLNANGWRRGPGCWLLVVGCWLLVVVVVVVAVVVVVVVVVVTFLWGMKCVYF